MCCRSSRPPLRGREQYPNLLSNGNLIAEEQLADGRKKVGEDPFASRYLFALVAGDLAVLEDRFTTMSGRESELQIFSDLTISTNVITLWMP